MLKTGSEIARLKGVSKQAANNFIIKNAVPPSGKKGKYPAYDVDLEPLASYLADKRRKHPLPGASAQAAAGEAAQPPDERAKTPASRRRETAARLILKPLNSLLAGKMPPGGKPAEILYAQAARLADENKDPALYLKLAQIAAKEDADEAVRLQAIKTERAKEQIAQERAERLRIENEIARGGYIDRATVKTLFGRVYAAHTSVLTPLPLKLSDMIDALPPEPGRRERIHKMIGDEIYAALETIQRELIEYVRE